MTCQNTFRFGYFNQSSCETYPDPEIQQPIEDISTEGRTAFTKTPIICSRDRPSGQVMLQQRDLHLFAPPEEKKANPLDQIEDQIVTVQETSIQISSIIDEAMSQIKKYMKEKEELIGNEAAAQDVKEETEDNQMSIIDKIKDQLKDTD